MKIALIVVIVFVVATFGQNIKVISKLVQDLIKTESINILTVVSCWPQTDKFHFVKTLNIPIQMAGPSKMPTRVIDESTNKQWYFMDMRCIESHEFLLNIESAFFGHPYRWILLEPIADKLNKSTFLTDSNVLLINFNSNLSRAELKQGKSKLHLFLMRPYEMLSNYFQRTKLTRNYHLSTKMSDFGILKMDLLICVQLKFCQDAVEI